MRQMAIRFLSRNIFLVAAVVFEMLGLIAAFVSIPGIGLQTAWALALTGIFSCTGVLIVTGYFMYQYNRRPLNNFQKDEITRLLSEYTPSKEQREEIAGLLSEYTPSKEQREEIAGLLSEYTPSEELRNTFLQKAPNDREFAVFWMWRYQKSIMDFAWASPQLERQNGYVLVGELRVADALVRYVHHAVVPPPFSNVGNSLSNDGEVLPEGAYMNFESIFRGGQLGFRNTVVLYKASDSRIRVLRTDGSQKVVFSEERASPMLLAAHAETHLPRLVQSSDADGNLSWQWETPE